MNSGGLGVALPRRSRPLPEVYDDCSFVSRRLSSRDKAIIRELNETALALNILETGGIGCSESCEKWNTPSCPQNLLHLHFTRLYSVIFYFRPPSVTKSGKPLSKN